MKKFIAKYVILTSITAMLFAGMTTVLTPQRVNAVAVTCPEGTPPSEGACAYAPGQEFKIDSKSGNAKPFAPGEEAKSQNCIGCVKELTPGQQGLQAGIIGPPKKIIEP